MKHIGDGFMAAFPRPSDALACALAIQNAVTTASFAEPLRVRIGLHAGSPVREGTDFFGVDVTLASRITDLAAGGEILVSASLRGLVESSVPGGVFARSREVELKGPPVHIRFVLCAAGDQHSAPPGIGANSGSIF